MPLLNRLLSLLVLPLGLSLGLLTWGIVRRRTMPAAVGLAILLASTQPFVGRAAIRSAEGWSERPALATIAPADAIVVLSSGRVTAPGPDRHSEWGDANRFFGGLELHRAHKAPLLVFTGASGSGPGSQIEGNVLASYAREAGVSPERILVTGHVRNTADEARQVREMFAARGLGATRIVLVSSAFHMPRASAQFRREGFSVQPFPVDFAVAVDRRVSIVDFVPSVEALAQTERALREFYGRAFYWLRAPRA